MFYLASSQSLFTVVCGTAFRRRKASTTHSVSEFVIRVLNPQLHVLSHHIFLTLLGFSRNN
jgi:hypothetical protein